MASATKALILANGETPSAMLVREQLRQHDILLTTDGGANAALLLGVVPDIISGDFDSIDIEHALQSFPTAELVETPDQSRADLEKAISLLITRGINEITVIGAGGGRIDHLLANYALLIHFFGQVSLRFLDDFGSVYALRSINEACSLQLSTSPLDTISVISTDGLARVTLSGVKWPLNQTQIPIGTAGISNHALGNSVSIVVEHGSAFICHLKNQSS